MSTLTPRPPYTEAELAALYPPQLKLQLVQVLLRHGERTPVNSRFANTGLAAFWPYCSAARNIKSAVVDPDQEPGEHRPFSTLEWKRRLETFGHNDSAVIASGPGGELDSICDMGVLTDKGRETTLELGQRLRRLYVDQLGFLPKTLSDTDSLYLRATPIVRAQESLQQTFQGLYPAKSRVANLPLPTIITRAIADETLFPNDGNCRRFAELSRAFAQRAAERWNGTPEMAYLNKKLGRWMPDNGPGVAVDSHPRLSGVMDTINATYAHGPETRLPSEFYDPKARQIIDKIGVEEWYDGYKESREYRTLGIGGLLADVVSRMVGSAERSTADGQYEMLPNTKSSDGRATPIRFGLSGCHDTTLASALSSLGAFDNESWPPFTSHIAIELFRHANSDTSNAPSERSKPSTGWFASLFGGHPAGTPPAGIGRKPVTELTSSEKSSLQGYYVRLRYNDKPVAIPGCKPAGKHLEGDETFCTLEAFKSIVDKFSPYDWKKQCRSNIKAPAFPTKPEPAGY